VLPAGIALGHGGSAAAGPKKAPKRSAKKGGSAASGDSVAAPMQGTIVKVVAAEGQQVAAGETVVILEAMKMEQPLTAHKAGTVTGLTAEVGATVPSGTVLLEIKD
jgi:acetyl-CoA/propionyl-CoA carboxylase biotin carboxyl carrier protein